VNVGASSAIASFDRFGYPICTVCGQSVSPLSSDRQRAQFDESHQERCGRAITPVGFYADVVADALSLPSCPDQATAYSMLEALRFAASQVLDMTMDDLQVLVLGHVDRDDVDAVLWDPMPGGSGLLDQICERFNEIVAVATEVVSDCPSACTTSCIDCLQTFRNGFYHKHLNRLLAEEKLRAWGGNLTFAHPIPAKQPSQAPAAGTQPVNEAERRLRHLLLAAGFEEGIRGEQIVLDRAVGSTTPDIIYRTADHAADEGICVYLDGLSEHIHGNPATAERDARIRAWLRNNGYEVLEIPVSDLADEAAMTRWFRKLAGYLNAPDLRNRVAADRSWFRGVEAHAPASERPALKLVRPAAGERYATCVPFVALKAAAGYFGDPTSIPDEEEWEHWAEVDTARTLRPGMFVAQVVGRSMEPGIPDGSYCLFSAPVAGSRQGKQVLVQLRDTSDPETGERYTVKRYESEKGVSEDGTWRHVRVVLKPTNREFEPIVLTVEDEGSVQVIAEVVQVLGGGR
jgi:SOS-response transcriptional repressor LexA